MRHSFLCPGRNFVSSLDSLIDRSRQPCNETDFGTGPGMRERTGEKIGWTGGWMGGFLWVAVLSIVFIYQGKHLQGFLGLSLVCIAFVMIIFFTPWRFPATPYWKLMFAPYGLFLLSVLWAIWSYGGAGSLGLNWWNMLWIFPVLTPWASIGKRKWTDGSVRREGSQEAAKPYH